MTAKEQLLQEGYVDINKNACLCTDEWLSKNEHTPSFDENRTWIAGFYDKEKKTFLTCLCDEENATHFFSIGEDRFFINLHFEKYFNTYSMESLFMKYNDINLQRL